MQTARLLHHIQLFWAQMLHVLKAAHGCLLQVTTDVLLVVTLTPKYNKEKIRT